MTGLAVKNAGPGTMVTGEAVVPDRFVLISSSTLLYADGGEEPIGLTQEAVASGAQCAYEFLDAGIHKVTGSKAITAGSAIYVTTDGKVSDAAVGKQIGILLGAITGDGGKAEAIVWGPRGGNDAMSSNMSNMITFEDDFLSYDPTATVGDWALAEDAGAEVGTTLVADQAGGILSIGTDGDAEDAATVSSLHENWKFQTDKKLYFECKLVVTEAATNVANWAVGLSDLATVDLIQDGTAGPAASYDGAIIFKIDSTMKIQFETSNAGTQVTNADVEDFVSGTSYVVGFFYDYNDGVTAKVTPYVDGVAGTTHDLVISGLEEMHIVLSVKNGGTAEESMEVDYVRVQMER